MLQMLPKTLTILAMWAITALAIHTDPNLGFWVALIVAITTLKLIPK